VKAVCDLFDRFLIFFFERTLLNAFVFLCDRRWLSRCEAGFEALLTMLCSWSTAFECGDWVRVGGFDFDLTGRCLMIFFLGTLLP